MSMERLKQQVIDKKAMIKPASSTDVDGLQEALGFTLSAEYKEYLQQFGVIVFDAYETYGLGVSDDYFLHVLNAYKDLSRDANYLDQAVPLLEVGDGHYYLYNNATESVFLWATPNGGFIRTVSEDLETFLLERIFSQ